MSEVNLIRNGHLIEDLGGALRSGKHGLSTVPGLLKRVLQEESWREFTTQRGEHIQHDRFAGFVVAQPLAGIGAPVELLGRIVSDDNEARDLLDRALQSPVGGSAKVSLSVDNINGENDLGRPTPPRGTSKDYALRKLRKDAPALHANVLAGALSPHAAMVRAGYRPATFTVRPDPASAARTLRKRMTPEQLAELARLLTEGG